MKMANTLRLGSTAEKQGPVFACGFDFVLPNHVATNSKIGSAEDLFHQHKCSTIVHLLPVENLLLLPMLPLLPQKASDGAL